MHATQHFPRLRSTPLQKKSQSNGYQPEHSKGLSDPPVLYTRLGVLRGARSWKWPICTVIFGGRDTVLLRSFASSSLDLFAVRCGVVTCRLRSLSISPSLSCSIATIVNRSLLSPRASAVYTRTYVRLRAARGVMRWL